MKITELLPGDWEKLKTITLESLQEEPKAFPTSYKRKLAFSEYKWSTWLLPFNEHSKSVSLFMINDHDEVVGKVTAVLSDETQIEIVGLYIRKSYRSQGFGRQLLAELLEKINLLIKNRKLVLIVNAEEKEAVSLFESMGFLHAGTEEKMMGDGITYNLLVMEF